MLFRCDGIDSFIQLHQSCTGVTCTMAHSHISPVYFNRVGKQSQFSNIRTNVTNVPKKIKKIFKI